MNDKVNEDKDMSKESVVTRDIARREIAKFLRNDVLQGYASATVQMAGYLGATTWKMKDGEGFIIGLTDIEGEIILYDVRFSLDWWEMFDEAEVIVRREDKSGLPAKLVLMDREEEIPIFVAKEV